MVEKRNENETGNLKGDLNDTPSKRAIRNYRQRLKDKGQRAINTFLPIVPRWVLAYYLLRKGLKQSDVLSELLIASAEGRKSKLPSVAVPKEVKELALLEERGLTLTEEDLEKLNELFEALEGDGG